MRRNAPVRHVEYRDYVGSTNDLALELARQSIHGGNRPIALPALVLAAQQSAGRGRGANRWWSAPGALTFSLLLSPGAEFPREEWAKISLATAVAVCQLLDELLPHQAAGIRWPNDVYVAERKICGVLVEVPSLAAPAGPRIVLGLGLNVNNSLRDAPREVRDRAISLVELAGREFDLTDVLASLLRKVDQQIARLIAGDPRLSDEWQARCLLRGRRITLAQGRRTEKGIAREIGRDGALVLDTPAGPRRFFGGVLTAVE